MRHNKGNDDGNVCGMGMNEQFNRKRRMELNNGEKEEKVESGAKKKREYSE